MRNRYKALALDLDGTLTNSKKEITPKTKEVIRRAIAEGVKVILASGRPVLGIEQLAKELELYQDGGYILAYNGGHIIECHTGKTVSQKLIAPKYYHEICECGHKFDVTVLTYDEVGVIAEDDQAKYVQKEAFNNTIPIRKVENLEAAVKGEITKFMIVGEPEELKKALEYMQEKLNGILNVFLSEPYFMEVTPLGIEKASALQTLLDYLGFTREELMAIGDGLNDIPMLKFAGLSIAMENAYEETKKYADDVTLSNDEDGVAAAVEKYILSGGETGC